VAVPARFLSLLIPVYNNEHTLVPLNARIREALAGCRYEVVLVNDGSRDGSLVALKSIAAADPRVKVISFSRNFGQHPAIAAALEFAAGDTLVLMDADLEDRPENIPMLVRALEESGADVVYTIKRGQAASARSMSSDLYHHAIATSVGVAMPRQMGTFRVFTRKVCNALRQFPERHVLYGPLMFYAGFRHVIVPVDRDARVGPSSYSFAKRLRLAVNSLVTYSDLPPKLFGVIGTAMVVMPLLYAGVVLAQYMLMGRSLPQGLTVVVLLVTGLGGMIMLALGVLGVYIFRIFQEVLARPRYLVDETVNLESSSDGRP
jgi:glycosyltransferase involved in cell wall biosynthesis